MPQIVQPPMARLQLTDEKGMPSAPGKRFLQKITDALNGTFGVIAPQVGHVMFGTGISQLSGTGSPNGVVPGNIGDQYLNTAGGAGATLFVKESGAPGSKTGWQSK